MDFWSYLMVLRIVIFLLIFGVVNPVVSMVSADPVLKSSRIWRVIYVEAGPYRDYRLNLYGLAQGLYDYGLIDAQPPLELYSDEDESLDLWSWLSTSVTSQNLQFLKDGFYSANWSDEQQAKNKKEILERLERGEIDLILTLGTSAGQSLITDEHTTPILSISSTDPVAAGISLTQEDSGRDNVHVQVVAGAVEYQLAMFYNMFKFKTLGVPYDSTKVGQSTMAIPTVEKMAKEKGFAIVPCVTDLEIEDLEQSYQNLQKCIDKLSVDCEAIYLTVNNGMQEKYMERILTPIITNQLPSFSQFGPSETKQGVLASLGQTDFIGAGRFEAEVIRKIIYGQIPRKINQVYLPPLTMALNLKMAQLIGWNPSFEVLVAVDELYNHVTGRD
jgi:ABC-type uncharacterized transport system substrate-binding protein